MTLIKFIDKSVAGLGVGLVIVLTLGILSLALFESITEKNAVPEEVSKTEKEIQKEIRKNTTTHTICIQGHWYAERIYRGARMRAFYGIVPLFDVDGNPMKCPLERSTL
jgi:hypothetical protein